jgi:hypothetical protein
MTMPMESRRKRIERAPNKLAPDLAELFAAGVEGTEWGPAMLALPSDRHRAFVFALYQIKPGYGAHVKAAKLAGFGTSTSSAKSWSVIASRLAHDEKILAALFEEDQKRIRASAPRALRALTNLVEDPRHKDHTRAIGMVLDRVHPAETTHHVKVEHSARVDVGNLNERLLEIALTFGLDPQKVLTTPQKALANDPPTIEGEYREIK